MHSIKIFSASVVTSGIIVAAMCLAGCNNTKKTDQNVQVVPKNDTASSGLLKINNQIFSIPSPIQTALLIKKNGYSYDKKVLNAAENYSKYTTKYKQALNLGVYGADLGYISLYDQSQDALVYMASVEKLATDVGVANAFDAALLKRFQVNMGKQDSLLSMVSEAFRKSDAYFKDNKQGDISSLILVGGWVESLYFATEANAHTNQKDIVRRIAEQKISLQNLIKMLAPYGSRPEYADLIKNLTNLSNVFDNVEFVYNFVAPTVDAANKVTNVNSTSEVKISPEQLKEITEKVEAIRNQIAG